MDFVAIDVETANADIASICQIGIAEFRNGALTNTWKSYIDPQDDFDDININIHGIKPLDVVGAPNFQQIRTPLYRYLNKKIVVCHSHFDRSAIHKAARAHNVAIPDSTWIDSAKVARRAWPEMFATGGYGLANVADFIGHDLAHHDALEDAIAAGMVMLRAVQDSGLSLDEWVTRIGKPIHLDSTTGHQIKRQDLFKLAGKEKSTKHLKAESLIRDGVPIRILSESDFMEMISLA